MNQFLTPYLFTYLCPGSPHKYCPQRLSFFVTDVTSYTDKQDHKYKETQELSPPPISGHTMCKIRYHNFWCKCGSFISFKRVVQACPANTTPKCEMNTEPVESYVDLKCDKCTEEERKTFKIFMTEWMARRKAPSTRSPIPISSQSYHNTHSRVSRLRYEFSVRESLTHTCGT